MFFLVMLTDTAPHILWS